MDEMNITYKKVKKIYQYNICKASTSNLAHLIKTKSNRTYWNLYQKLLNI